jgi:hypothetical protein
VEGRSQPNLHIYHSIRLKLAPREYRSEALPLEETSSLHVRVRVCALSNISRVISNEASSSELLIHVFVHKCPSVPKREHFSIC